MLFAATTSSSSSHGSPAIIFIYIVLFGALYFFFIRPRSRKAKAQRLEARQVEIGDRAQTVGGFVGTVVARTDEFVTLRSSSGVELDFIPSAIARRYDPAPAVDTEALEVHADHEQERPAEGDAE